TMRRAFGRWLRAGLIPVFLMSGACSSDEGGNGGGKNPNEQQFVDRGNFKNTTSKDEFISKGKAVGSYFDLSDTKAQFASGGGNPQVTVAPQMLLADDLACEEINTYE